MKKYDGGFLPFYAGQKVILNPSITDRHWLKHGITYTISECVSKINPVNGKGPFVYVGFIGYNNGASWFSPELVVPIEELTASIMTFSEIQTYKPLEILINN